MPILKHLLTHTVIATIAMSGFACFCPAGAAAMAAPAAVRAGHAHVASTDNGEKTPDPDRCLHEACRSGCTQVAAASAKSATTAPGKAPPQLDDIELLPPALVSRPATSRQPDLFPLPSDPPWLSQDSPVRRFDRLLD